MNALQLKNVLKICKNTLNNPSQILTGKGFVLGSTHKIPTNFPLKFLLNHDLWSILFN